MTGWELTGAVVASPRRICPAKQGFSYGGGCHATRCWGAGEVTQHGSCERSSLCQLPVLLSIVQALAMPRRVSREYGCRSGHTSTSLIDTRAGAVSA